MTDLTRPDYAALAAAVRYTQLAERVSMTPAQRWLRNVRIETVYEAHVDAWDAWCEALDAARAELAAHLDREPDEMPRTSAEAAGFQARAEELERRIRELGGKFQFADSMLKERVKP
jgi:hypothetical protein